MTSVRSLIEVIGGQFHHGIDLGDRIEQSDAQPEDVARRPQLSRPDNYHQHENIERNAKNETNDPIDLLIETQMKSGQFCYVTVTLSSIGVDGACRFVHRSVIYHTCERVNLSDREPSLH